MKQQQQQKQRTAYNNTSEFRTGKNKFYIYMEFFILQAKQNNNCSN